MFFNLIIRMLMNFCISKGLDAVTKERRSLNDDSLSSEQQKRIKDSGKAAKKGWGGFN
jgi:hypothetical protein